jgi:predicted RNA binding protein YcfA (HicA-like mRNA interferase family)
MKDREVVEKLKAAGWTVLDSEGKHSLKMRNPDGTVKIPIPRHKGKDINPITLKRIEKETGVKMK